MGVQCCELFGGIALKNHTFSFFFSLDTIDLKFRFFSGKTCADYEVPISPESSLL